MTLRIKNWERFQHYKGRTPPWIKLYRGLLDDPEWFALSGDASKMLANCWLLASERGGQLPPIATVAFRLRMSEKKASELISQLNHWVEDDASTMLAECKQNACLETDTERETDKDKKDGAVAIATRPSSNEEFLEFLKTYPRRQGANPKHPARKKFEAHVKSGVSPETIIAAARAYEAEQRKLGNIGTPYIAQAVTWLNQQRFEDYTQKNGTGPPSGLTPEQQAKWVRDQLEAERATNETANHSSGCVLERSEEIRGSPAEGGRSTGVVFDFPRNAEAH